MKKGKKKNKLKKKENKNLQLIPKIKSEVISTNVSY